MGLMHKVLAEPKNRPSLLQRAMQAESTHRIVDDLIASNIPQTNTIDQPEVILDLLNSKISRIPSGRLSIVHAISTIIEELQLPKAALLLQEDATTNLGVAAQIGFDPTSIKKMYINQEKAHKLFSNQHKHLKAYTRQQASHFSGLLSQSEWDNLKNAISLPFFNQTAGEQKADLIGVLILVFPDASLDVRTIALILGMLGSHLQSLIITDRILWNKGEIPIVFHNQSDFSTAQPSLILNFETSAILNSAIQAYPFVSKPRILDEISSAIAMAIRYFGIVMIDHGTQKLRIGIINTSIAVSVIISALKQNLENMYPDISFDWLVSSVS